MSKKPLSRSLKSWFRKGSNLLALAAIIISGVALYNQISPIFPARARLTLIIDYPRFLYESDSNATVLTVFVKAVNDSPLTATIREWTLFLNYNVTYQTLSQTDSHMALILTPSAQTDFNLTRTLIGENNRALPQNALRSIVVTILYDDYLGLQEARRDYGFL
jgi:hypothetical protein